MEGRRLYNTCRICKDLIKDGELGIRHPTNCRMTVHARCGIAKHGKDFIDNWCHDWQLPLLPVIALSTAGLLKYTEDKLALASSKEANKTKD